MSKQLNVTHFSTADNLGGSGRAAYRIHLGLRGLGHQSKMLVGQKSTTDKDVDTVYKSGAFRILDRVTEEASHAVGLQYLYYPSSTRVLNHGWVKSADIFQIYNTHGGYLTHRIFPALSKIGPIVWRLSDMWPMTGHCAYPGVCDRWKSGCGQCPDLKTAPTIKFDTTAFLWRVKNKVYTNSNITIVAPSNWIKTQAEASPLLNRFDIHLIPNGLDLNVFHPISKSLSRQLFNIDTNKKVILFTVNCFDNNDRKGIDYLIQAINKIGPIENTLLLLCGEGNPEWLSTLPIPVLSLGYIKDDRLMAAVYSCADVLVVSSVVENLPNNLLEAMACGTPSVAFDVGGVGDAVKHLKTGYLAKYLDAEDLADGITKLLGNEKLGRYISLNSKELIEKEFNSAVQADRFIDLYHNLL